MMACYEWAPLAEITRKRTGGLLRKLFESLMQFPDDLATGDALKAVGIRGVAGALGEMAARHPVFDLEMFDHRLDGGTPLERRQATVHLVGDLGWPCPLLSAVPRMMSTTVHRALSDAYGPKPADRGLDKKGDRWSSNS
jgi:hypothetical protein